MNKSDKNAAFKAYIHIRDWCKLLGFPCGNCPFSILPYDDEVCALADIILDGDKFKGYKLPKKKIDELADRGVEIMTDVTEPTCVYCRNCIQNEAGYTCNAWGYTAYLSPHRARVCEYFELFDALYHTMKKRGSE